MSYRSRSARRPLPHTGASIVPGLSRQQNLRLPHLGTDGFGRGDPFAAGSGSESERSPRPGLTGIAPSVERRQRLDLLKQNRRRRNLHEDEDLRGYWADLECRQKWDKLRRERAQQKDKERAAQAAFLAQQLAADAAHALDSDDGLSRPTPQAAATVEPREERARSNEHAFPHLSAAAAASPPSAVRVRQMTPRRPELEPMPPTSPPSSRPGRRAAAAPAPDAVEVPQPALGVRTDAANGINFAGLDEDDADTPMPQPLVPVPPRQPPISNAPPRRFAATSSQAAAAQPKRPALPNAETPVTSADNPPSPPPTHSTTIAVASATADPFRPAAPSVPRPKAQPRRWHHEEAAALAPEREREARQPLAPAFIALGREELRGAVSASSFASYYAQHVLRDCGTNAWTRMLAAFASKRPAEPQAQAVLTRPTFAHYYSQHFAPDCGAECWRRLVAAFPCRRAATPEAPPDGDDDESSYADVAAFSVAELLRAHSAGSVGIRGSSACSQAISVEMADIEQGSTQTIPEETQQEGWSESFGSEALVLIGRAADAANRESSMVDMLSASLSPSSRGCHSEVVRPSTGSSFCDVRYCDTPGSEVEATAAKAAAVITARATADGSHAASAVPEVACSSFLEFVDVEDTDDGDEIEAAAAEAAAHLWSRAELFTQALSISSRDETRVDSLRSRTRTLLIEAVENGTLNRSLSQVVQQRQGLQADVAQADLMIERLRMQAVDALVASVNDGRLDDLLREHETEEVDDSDDLLGGMEDHAADSTACIVSAAFEAYVDEATLDLTQEDDDEEMRSSVREAFLSSLASGQLQDTLHTVFDASPSEVCPPTSDVFEEDADALEVERLVGMATDKATASCSSSSASRSIGDSPCAGVRNDLAAAPTGDQATPSCSSSSPRKPERLRSDLRAILPSGCWAASLYARFQSGPAFGAEASAGDGEERRGGGAGANGQGPPRQPRESEASAGDGQDDRGGGAGANNQDPPRQPRESEAEKPFDRADLSTTEGTESCVLASDLEDEDLVQHWPVEIDEEGFGFVPALDLTLDFLVEEHAAEAATLDASEAGTVVTASDVCGMTGAAEWQVAEDLKAEESRGTVARRQPEVERPLSSADQDHRETQPPQEAVLFPAPPASSITMHFQVATKTAPAAVVAARGGPRGPSVGAPTVFGAGASMTPPSEMPIM